jgi:serpin B
MDADVAAAAAVARFAGALHGELARAPGNLVYSPVNIAVALAFAAAGARGTTAAEFARVLSLPGGAGPETGTGTAPDFAGLLRCYQRGAAVEVAAAAALWPAVSATVVPAFREVARKAFAAEVEALDFTRAAAAAERINAWASAATRGRIPQVLRPDQIPPALRLIISTAIWFRGCWEDPFAKECSLLADFFTRAGTVRVPMMRDRSRRFHACSETADVVGISYTGGEVVLALIVPVAREGLAATEAELARRGVDAFTGGLRDKRVDLAMPRLRLQTGMSLLPALQRLGLRDACDPARADLTGMLAPGAVPDVIGMVEHLAMVEIDEEGTTAAAVTLVGPVAGCIPPPEAAPVVVRADHPFLFLIRDLRTGTVLFMGRVEDPLA